MLEAMGRAAAHGSILEFGDFQRNRAKDKGRVRVFASARHRPLRQAAARPFMRSFLFAGCFAGLEVVGAHLCRAAVLIALVADTRTERGKCEKPILLKYILFRFHDFFEVLLSLSVR